MNHSDDNRNAENTRDHPTPQTPVVRPAFLQPGRNPSTSASFPTHQYHLFFDDSEDMEDDVFVEASRSASNETDAVGEETLQKTSGPSSPKPAHPEDVESKEPCCSSSSGAARLLPTRASIEESEGSEESEDVNLEDDEDADVTLTQDNASQVTTASSPENTVANSPRKPTILEIARMRDNATRSVLLRRHEPKIFEALWRASDLLNVAIRAARGSGEEQEDVGVIENLVFDSVLNGVAGLGEPEQRGMEDLDEVIDELGEHGAIEEEEVLPPLKEILQNPNEEEKRRHLSKLSSTIFDSYVSIKKTEQILEELKAHPTQSSSYEIQKKSRDLYVFTQSFNQKISWELGRSKPRKRFHWEQTEVHLLESVLEQPEPMKLAVLRQLFPVICKLYKRMKKLESTVEELEQTGQNSDDVREELEEVKEKFDEECADERTKKAAAIEMDRRSSRRQSTGNPMISVTPRKRGRRSRKGVEEDDGPSTSGAHALDAPDVPEVFDAQNAQNAPGAQKTPESPNAQSAPHASASAQDAPKAQSAPYASNAQNAPNAPDASDAPEAQEDPDDDEESEEEDEEVTDESSDEESEDEQMGQNPDAPEDDDDEESEEEDSEEEDSEEEDDSSDEEDEEMDVEENSDEESEDEQMGQNPDAPEDDDDEESEEEDEEDSDSESSDEDDDDLGGMDVGENLGDSEDSEDSDDSDDDQNPDAPEDVAMDDVVQWQGILLDSDDEDTDSGDEEDVVEKRLPTTSSSEEKSEDVHTVHQTTHQNSEVVTTVPSSNSPLQNTLTLSEDVVQKIGVEVVVGDVQKIPLEDVDLQNLQNHSEDVKDSRAPEDAHQNRVKLSDDVQNSEVGDDRQNSDDVKKLSIRSEDVAHRRNSEDSPPPDAPIQNLTTISEDVLESTMIVGEEEDVAILQNSEDTEDVQNSEDTLLNPPGTSKNSVVSRKRAHGDSEEPEKKKKKKRKNRAKRRFFVCSSGVNLKKIMKRNDWDSDSDDDGPENSHPRGWIAQMYW